MTDNVAEIVVRGNTGGATSAIEQLKSTVTGAFGEIKSQFQSLHSIVETATAAFIAFKAVMAGGEAFHKIIELTKEWESQAIKLGITLGINTGQASEYMVAIEAVGGSTEDFTSASRGLTRQIRTQSEALNHMGIKTKDAAGHMRPFNDILFDAINVVNSYTQGTDRNIAAQVVFGRGANANSAVLRLTKEGMAEARDEAEALGLTVGKENVEAYLENRKATAGMTATLTGMGKAIGDALLPILSQLEVWFRDIGPAAIVGLKGAVGGLSAVFWGLYTSISITWDIIKLFVGTVMDALAGFGVAISRALTLDFKGAKQAMGDAMDAIKARTARSWDEIVADAEKANAKLTALFANQTPAEDPKKGKDAGDLVKKPKGGDERLAAWRLELNTAKDLGGAFREHDIKADIDFWNQKLELIRGNTDEDKKLRMEVAEQILTAKKRLREQELKLDEEQVAHRKAMALEDIAIEKDRLATELAAGEITKAQEIKGQMALEDKRYEIEASSIRERINLVYADVVERQKAMDELELAEKKHAANMQKLDTDLVREQRKPWADFFKSLESGYESVFRNLLNGSRSFGQSMRGLFATTAQGIVGELAKIGAHWVVTQLAMTHASIAGNTARSAADETAAVKSKAITNKTALSGIQADAAKAMSGAYQAIVGIPYVGPILAPIAAGVAGAAVFGFEALVGSAAGGYDIPYGVNPLTQLHEKEMVLPAKHADVIRDLADNGAGQGSPDVHLHVHAIDAASVKRLFERNGEHLAKTMKVLHTQAAFG